MLLAAGGVETVIKTIDTTVGNYSVLTYSDANFIVILDRVDGTNWSSLEIYDSSGTTLLQNISLTGASYIGDVSTFLYGNNKMTFVFFDDSGPGEHYIINYNGNTNTISTTTVDAVTYPEYFTYYRENYYPSSSPSENMYMLFYGQLGEQSKSLYPVDYVKILSLINESPTIDSYVFQNSGTFDKSISALNGVTNTLFIPVDDGDGILSVLSLNSNGNTITSTGLPISGITDISWVTSFGDNFAMRIVNTGDCTDNVFVYGNDGLLRDSLSDGIFDNFATNYNTLYVGDVSSLGSCGDDKSYYINNQNSGFTQTSLYFNERNNQSACYIPNFTYNGAIIMYNNDLSSAQIITPNSVSEIFQINPNDFYYGGTNYFMGLSSSGATLYDFNGNIVSTNNQMSDNSCENYCYGAVSSRYFYTDISGENSIFNLSSPESNRNITMWTNSGSNYYLQLNDSIYNNY
jgi:hypothetical protein